MQKKLLSLVMVIGFGSVCCNETNTQENKQAKEEFKETFRKLRDDRFGTNEENLARYEIQLINDYTKALIVAVSDNGNAAAINDKFNENQADNLQKLNEKNLELDDSKEGYFNFFATPASENSIKGLSQKDWKDLQTKQDERNTTYKDKYVQHQNNYNAHVKTAMQNKLRERHYNLFGRYLDGLEKCGNDGACLKKRDISWKRVQNPDFLNSQDEQIFDSLYELITENNIPLSREQLITIANTIAYESQNPNLKGKSLTEQIALGKVLVNEKVHRILNPELEHKPKIDLTGENQDQEEIKSSILDPKEDQNNQGALSE